MTAEAEAVRATFSVRAGRCAGWVYVAVKIGPRELSDASYS